MAGTTKTMCVHWTKTPGFFENRLYIIISFFTDGKMLLDSWDNLHNNKI